MDKAFQRFLPQWIEEVKSGRRSLVRVLFRNCWKQWLVSFILTLISQVLQIVVPTMIGTITEYLTSEPVERGGTGGTVWEGVLYVAIVGGASIAISITSAVGTFLLQEITLWIRHFLQMLIYQKSLGMRASDIKDQGKCLNLISTDANSFIAVFHMINGVLTSPFLLIVTIYLLYQTNGWVGLLTALIVMVLFPITLFLTRQIGKNIRVYQARSDGRIKLTNELIHGIRIIKYYVWERPFMRRIDEAREKELRTLVANGVLRTLNMTVNMSTSSIALLVTFAIDSAVLGNEITPTKVFTSYSVIAVMRQSFRQLGMFLNSYVQLSVAIERIDSFLASPDIGMPPEEMYTPIYPSQQQQDDDDDDEKKKNGEDYDAEIDADIPLITKKRSKKNKKSKKDKKGSNEDFSDESDDEDSEKDVVIDNSLAVSMNNATYLWGDDEVAIYNANFDVRKGELFMVIGSVGSGKSALIYSMINELKRTSGSCTINGSIAYIPQKPWILVIIYYLLLYYYIITFIFI